MNNRYIKFIYVFIFSISIQEILGSVDTTIKLREELIDSQLDFCRDQIVSFQNYHKDLVKNLSLLDGNNYYRALNYQAQQAHFFQEHMLLKLKHLGFASKKLGLSELDAIKNNHKSLVEMLKNLSTQQKKYQQEFQFCHLDDHTSFKTFNTKNSLIDGYEYLDKIPELELFLKDKSSIQLNGQLNSLQKHYINLVHWMHHELESQQVYQYIRDLKPVSFVHDGKTVNIKHWDPLHVFMGSLKRGFFTGVHSEDKDLFAYFYKRQNNEIMIRDYDEYHKISTMFPNSWDMKTCVSKAYEALQKIIDIKKGDAKYGCNNLIIKGITANGEVINIVIDPVKNLVISFYPES